MTRCTNYAYAVEHLAELCATATDDQEVAVIERPDGAPVALIDAAELDSIMETLHLYRSPANARRLLDAMAEAEDGGGIRMTVEELRAAVGLALDPK